VPEDEVTRLSDTPVEVQFYLSRVSQISVPHPKTCPRVAEGDTGR
jgi:hypothetical protein